MILCRVAPLDVNAVQVVDKSDLYQVWDETIESSSKDYEKMMVSYYYTVLYSFAI
jgi:hypothetical protein